MTILINNKRFDASDEGRFEFVFDPAKGYSNLVVADKLLNIYRELVWLPAPAAYTGPPLNSENLKVCIEQEAMYSPHSNINLATVGVGQCISLYLYRDEGGCAIIHVNSYQDPLDLEEILKRFPARNNLKAVLVGGLEMLLDTSRRNLNHILQSMCALSEEITIVSQRLIERNSCTDAGLKDYMFDFVIARSKYFYKKLFNKEMPSHMYSKFNPNYFNKEVNDPGLLPVLRYVLPEIIQINLFVKDEMHAAFMLKRERGHFNAITEETFPAIMDFIFTSSGWRVLNELKYCVSANVISEYCHFAFVHVNGAVQISKIRKNAYVEFEAERLIHLYRNDRKAIKPYYFLAFDGNNHVRPTIDNDLNHYLAELKTMLSGGVLTQAAEKYIKGRMRATDGFHTQMLGKAVMNYRLPSAAPPVRSPLIFHRVTVEDLEKEHDIKRQKMGAAQGGSA
ncbi:MAG: hypothetical protein ACHQAX_02725 [Gammaproteobacteria bacterium]